MPAERLQKIISNTGRASRREAERLILQGRVAVNGEVIRTLGARADTEQDEVTVDGVPLETGRYRYFALHKPRGFVTTARDDRGRPTVLDLVPVADVVLHPVGRLDVESEGLVLLTNDGTLTNLLTHPRHQVEKEYLVAIDGPLSETSLARAVRGVRVGGERLRFASARPTLPPAGAVAGAPEDAAWLLVTLRQGRKREIRRLLDALGRRVLLLRRIRIGPLALGALGSGAFRELTQAEVAALYGAAAGAARRFPPGPRKGDGEERRPPPELPWNIAIDGPAASGKSSVGQALAERLGYRLLDTGLMYRAFAHAALERGVPPEGGPCRELAESLPIDVQVGRTTRVLVEGEDVTDRLRTPAVEAAVSAYSALPEVREVMVRKQRAIARSAPTVVLGRDIGTVVLPQAPVKIYLDASEAARAARRGRQAREGEGGAQVPSARRAVADRDSLDSSRSTGPLRRADDAIYIDTTDIPLEEVIRRVLREIGCDDC